MPRKPCIGIVLIPDRHSAPADTTVAAVRQATASKREQRAARALDDAVDAFCDPHERFTRLAGAAETLAAALRGADEAQLRSTPLPPAASDDSLIAFARSNSWTANVEWQAFDRAFEALIAMECGPAQTLAGRAGAYQALSHAAYALAAALADGRAITLQPSCSFCGAPRDQVRELVAGIDARICDRCIADATARLHRGP